MNRYLLAAAVVVGLLASTATGGLVHRIQRTAVQIGGVDYVVNDVLVSEFNGTDWIEPIPKPVGRM